MAEGLRIPRVEATTAEAVAPAPRPSPSLPAEVEIERLRAQVQIQAAIIRAQSARLEQMRTCFDGAFEAARVGVWECSLPQERLVWTDVVYDLFGLPRACALERQQILTRYAPHSLHKLTELRSRAIAQGGGFAFDAEIADGERRRWIRITATVETVHGVPIRLFGMKQDVTEQRREMDRMRRRAEIDVLTGLANRARFEDRLAEPIGTLLLVDLDGFKQVNDTFGHAQGDACLAEAAARLSSVCRRADLVARIGGDEFAVVIGERLDSGAASGLAARIVDALRRPVTGDGRDVVFGASVGIAFGGVARSSDLVAQADAALYAAKAAGRNTFRIFTP